MRIEKAVERWFEVPEDKDKARVKIKHLKPGEIQDIIDEVMVQEIVYKRPKDGEEVEGVIRQQNNRKLDREKTVLAAVVGWEKFFDLEGKKMGCDEANVLRAIRMIDGFADFVADCRKQLSEDVADEMKAQKKT